MGRRAGALALAALLVVGAVGCSGGAGPKATTTSRDELGRQGEGPSSSAGPTSTTAPPSTTGTTASDVAACTAPETLRTAVVAGRPQFVDPSGAVVQVRGVNVRFERRLDGTLPEVYSARQFASIRAFGMRLLRVAIRWRDLEPTEGVLDEAFAEQLDRFTTAAGAAGLEVLLDPIHVGGGDAEDQFVPRWANGGRPVDTDAVMGALEAHGLDYLTLVLRRWCARSAVVGLELVNEPREDRRQGGDLRARNVRLVSLYQQWIARLRTIDPNKLLFVEPYYGITEIDPDLVAVLARAGGAGRSGGLVWAPHDYHTGGSGDGYSDDGYPLLDANDAGSYTSRGVYPSDPEARRARRRDDVAHLAPQQAAADAAGMPMLVGEFGIPYGWTNRRDLLCDKARVYREHGWSWTVWALDDVVDAAYGLWNPMTARWDPIADPLAGGPTAC